MIGALVGFFSRGWGWAKTHKNIAIPIATGLACGCAAWFLKPAPPQPAVHLQEEAHAAESTKATADTTSHEGPKKKATIDFDPAPGAPAAVVNVPGIGPVNVPAGERIEGMALEEDAGSDTSTHAVAEAQRTEDRKLDLTVTPQPRPGWQLQVGVEDVLGPRTLRLAARRRLFGPFWAELSAVPAQRSVGAALAVEF